MSIKLTLKKAELTVTRLNPVGNRKEGVKYFVLTHQRFWREGRTGSLNTDLNKVVLVKEVAGGENNGHRFCLHVHRVLGTCCKHIYYYFFPNSIT